MAVQTRGNLCKPRSIYKLGFLGSNVHFGVHNNSLNNLRRGIAERVLYIRNGDEFTKTPVPLRLRFNQRMREFKHRVLAHTGSTTPVLRNDFPKLYRGRKRVRYEDAVTSLSTKALTKRDSWLSAFVKAEKIAFSLKPDPAPRVIQPRDPRYNVEVGKFLKPNEHRFYKAVNRTWGETTIAKGLNLAQRGALVESKFNSYNHPVAIGLDASRFDQHVSITALQWEHSIYNSCFRSSELAELLRMQLVNKGVGRAKDGTIKYAVEGCRMSGDMNTALGNCILMSGMVYSYCLEKGISAKLINDGDDCVVFMEQSDESRFSDGLHTWFSEMGFNMKVEDPVYELEKLEFCQCSPVWTPDGYIMVRNPWISLAKDCLSIKPLDCPSVMAKWCTEVGNCGLSLTGGIPVVSAFYRLLVDSFPGTVVGRMADDPVFETGMRIMARGMDRSGQQIHHKTRFSFYLAFGIEPERQELWEEYYGRYKLAFQTPCLHIETSPSFIASRSVPQCFVYDQCQ